MPDAGEQHRDASFAQAYADGYTAGLQEAWLRVAALKEDRRFGIVAKAALSYACGAIIRQPQKAK